MAKSMLFVGTDSNSNYVKKLLDRLNNNPWPEPGVHMVEVQHDHWCRIFKGKACNCNPDIKTK